MSMIKRRHLVKLSLFLALSAVIYMGLQLKVLATHFHAPMFGFFHRSSPKAKSLAEAVGYHFKQVSWERSGSMKFIILAMTDISFTDMAINLYLSSFKRFDISNFLFVGGGMNACEILNRLRIQCFDFWEDPDSNSSKNYGSLEFIRKMNIRTEMILVALRAGYSVLHTDLDVVFLRNPMPEIENHLKDNDMAILWDHAVYNAGFLAIKASPFSIDVYAKLQSLTNASAKLDDQKALNRALNEVKEQYTKDSKKHAVVVLDKNRFLCGKDYFERNRRDFPPLDFKDNCPNCTVVHNNWIVTKEAKVYRFKETAMWFLDDGRYYSDKDRKYLMFYNPMIRKTPADFDVRHDETAALRTGFKIAAMLNRTLILPRFHCEQNKECPINCWFKVKTFHQTFRPNYRESSFLLNDLVPEAISMKPRKGCQPDGKGTSSALETTSNTTCNRRDSGNGSECVPFRPVPILVLTKDTADRSKYPTSLVLEEFPNSQILDLSTRDHLDEATVVERFAKCSDQVLVLSALLRVKAKFSDPQVEASFEKRLNEGLIRGSYVQI